MQRLILKYRSYETDTFCDFLLLIATEIEDSMIAAGAVPGEDYKILDIFQMAIQIQSKKVFGDGR
jgi:hypothetical protein